MLFDLIRFAGERRFVHFQIVRLNDDAIGRKKVAILDDTDITDDDIFDWNLSHDIAAHDVEFLIEFDFRLQTTELTFLGPIIECRNENNNNDGYDDSSTFDPFDVRLLCKKKDARSED